MSADNKDEGDLASKKTSQWISRREIASIAGALKPGAYVARAYLVLKDAGRAPDWARKTEAGKWQFDRDYIIGDGQQNLKTIGISEAADHVGTSRRTIQTWFDDGVLQAFEDDRAAGESRHIDRAAFMKALPDLKRRLGGPLPGATAPSLPADQIDESMLSRTDRRSIAALRKRLADARSRREAVLKDIRSAEKAATAQDTICTRIATRMNKLRRQFNERLRALEKTQSYAERKQAAECDRARRLSVKAQDMLAREADIEKALDDRLVASKRRQAEALSRRLEQARRPENAPAAAPQNGGDLLRAVTRRLRPGADTDVDPSARDAAEHIAEALIVDVDAGVLDRIDAAILFNTLAEEQQIPTDVRIVVTRDYFSRG